MAIVIISGAVQFAKHKLAAWQRDEAAAFDSKKYRYY
jgi:hypothetical protein